MFKQMPGTIMAMGRLNRPSIMIYGGTIKVENWRIISVIIVFYVFRSPNL